VALSHLEQADTPELPGPPMSVSAIQRRTASADCRWA
jgi:hypothetical protein